jgi:hypothetical protein
MIDPVIELKGAVDAYSRNGKAISGDSRSSSMAGSAAKHIGKNASLWSRPPLSQTWPLCPLPPRGLDRLVGGEQTPIDRGCRIAVAGAIG